MGRRVTRYLPLVLILLALVGAALAANSAGPRVGAAPHVALPAGSPAPPRTYDNTFFSPPPAPTGQSDQRARTPMVPGWVFLVVGAVVIAAGYLAVMLYLAIKMREAIVFRRRRPGAAETERHVEAPATPEQLRQAVAAGLAELISGDDPRAAVIACWLRLEDLAAVTGVPRMASDTPGDLVSRMLDGRLSPAGVRALRELTELYRSARYSAHPVAESARGAARAALRRLDVELTPYVRAATPAGAGS